jgi:hypothetical protein
MKTLLNPALGLALLLLSWGAPAQTVRQLTTNSTDETWGVRNSATSGGKALWIDASNSVVFFNGTTTNVVQPKGTNGTVENHVFTLGNGSAPGQAIGVWRRGSDGTSFVSINGAPPVLIVATNPYDPNNALNAEAVAVADGSVFMILSTGTLAPVFRVNPVSGQATNLTGGALVPGALFGRISTSAGQAVWPFTDNTNNIIKLHFYDGSTVRVVDTNLTSNPQIRSRWEVWTRFSSTTARCPPRLRYRSRRIAPARTDSRERTDATLRGFTPPPVPPTPTFSYTAESRSPPLRPGCQINSSNPSIPSNWIVVRCSGRMFPTGCNTVPVPDPLRWSFLPAQASAAVTAAARPAARRG